MLTGDDVVQAFFYYYYSFLDKGGEDDVSHAVVLGTRKMRGPYFMMKGEVRYCRNYSRLMGETSMMSIPDW